MNETTETEFAASIIAERAFRTEMRRKLAVQRAQELAARRARGF
jgi:hypothetical protein